MSDEEKKAAEEPKAEAQTAHSKPHKRRSRRANGKGKKEGGVMTKVIATVFGAVVAPILVAVGIGYFKPDNSKKEKEAPAAPATDKPAPTTQPEKKGGLLDLVGRDLDRYLYAFAWNPELKKDEKKDHVEPALFHYEEKPDRIVVPGGRMPALLTTKDEFEDYTLNFWYRWGDKQWGRAEGKPRRACLLLHITGTDGGFNGIFPTCIAVNLGEGDAGTLRLMGVQNRITCKARIKESDDRLRREYVGGDAKEIPLTTFDPEEWDGLILRRGFPVGVDREKPGGFLAGTPIRDRATLAESLWSSIGQAQLQQSTGVSPTPALVGMAQAVFRATGIQVEKGFHPLGDPLHRPPLGPGQWNRVVIESNKGTVSVSINRRRVNEISGLNLRKGRIAFASQWNEYEIGKIVLEVKEPDPPPEAAEKEPEKTPRKKRS